MAIYKLGENTPQIHPSAFIADSADIIGDVVIEANASVWFNVTIRGDGSRITIGENSNVQDGSVLHATERYSLTIGKNVTVGHLAALHGCTIGDGAVIGIQASVLNGAVIAENTLISAGALVGEGKIFEKNAVLMGVPAKSVKIMNAEEFSKISWIPGHYAKNGKRFSEKLVKIDRSDLNDNLNNDLNNDQ